MKYLSRDQNTQIITKLASTVAAERDEASKKVNNLLMTTTYETGVARKYFTKDTSVGVRIISPGHEFYDTTTDDKPAVKYSIQPEIGVNKDRFAERAVAMTPYGRARKRTFRGTRFIETFEPLSTEKFEKNVNELYTYDYDIVEYFENVSVKTLLDLEDTLFFSLNNYLLSLNNSALSDMNILTTDRASFNVFLFSQLRDFHNEKLVPASRLLVHYALFNETERTVAVDIEGMAREGIEGNLNLPSLFGMTPIIINTAKYVYYSFEKAHATNKKETDQFFIKLSSVSTAVPGSLSAADHTYIADRLAAMGYKYIGLGGVAVDGAAVASWSPSIPLDVTTNTTVLNGHCWRTYILPKQQFYGAFDLWLEDAQTIIDKKGKFMKFHSEEELIIVGKNPYAVTVLDLWERI